eukprot:g14324.t1
MYCGQSCRYLEFSIPADSLILSIPAVESAGAFDATIDWGDGVTDIVRAFDSAGLSHTYSAAGVYEVRVRGEFPGIRFANSDHASKLTRILSIGETGLTTLQEAFSRCTSLTSVAGIAGLESVTDMSRMFRLCTGLTSLDLSGWDTSSVTDMDWMFCECNSLTALDISDWDTSSVTSMRGMFYQCNTLTTLDLS